MQAVQVSLRPLHWSRPMTPSHPQRVQPSPLRVPPNRLVHLGQLFPQQSVQVQVSVWAQVSVPLEAAAQESGAQIRVQASRP